jgi:hypothetical protein
LRNSYGGRSQIADQMKRGEAGAAGVRMKAVKTIPIPIHLMQRPREDPHYPAAVERATEAARRLRKAGIIDAEERRIRNDLPVDMQEGSDRDFSG